MVSAFKSFDVLIAIILCSVTVIGSLLPWNIHCPRNDTIYETVAWVKPSVRCIFDNVTLISETDLWDNPCQGDNTHTETWSCTNDDGNKTAQCSWTLIFKGAPPIIQCPVDITLTVGDTSYNGDYGDATCTYGEIQEATVETDGCGGSKDITRYFRCGELNKRVCVYDYCTQRIVFQDTPPEIITPEEDTLTILIERFQVIAPKPKCSNGELSKTSETSETDLCSIYVYTWICTDDCGNTSPSWRQTIKYCDSIEGEPTDCDRFAEGDIVTLGAKGCDDECLRDPKYYSTISIKSDCHRNRQQWEITEKGCDGGIPKVKLVNMGKRSSNRGLYRNGDVLMTSADKAQWFWLQYDGTKFSKLENDAQCAYWDHCDVVEVQMKDCSEMIDTVGYSIEVKVVGNRNSMVQYLNWNEIGYFNLLLLVVVFCLLNMIWSLINSISKRKPKYELVPQTIN